MPYIYDQSKKIFRKFSRLATKCSLEYNSNLKSFMKPFRQRLSYISGYKIWAFFFSGESGLLKLDFLREDPLDLWKARLGVCESGGSLELSPWDVRVEYHSLKSASSSSRMVSHSRDCWRIKISTGFSTDLKLRYYLKPINQKSQYSSR